IPIEDTLPQAQIDYLYSMDYGNDGWWSGTWGIVRAHQQLAPTLFPPPRSSVPVVFTPATQAAFIGTCPANAPIRSYDITAVEANRVLPKNANVVVQDLFPNGHVGRSPNKNGSSLVYNHRTTTVGGQTVNVDPPGTVIVLPTHQGPIHDPTALIYTRTSDLTPFTVLSAAEVTAFDISSQLTVTTSTVTTTTTTGTTTLS